MHYRLTKVHSTEICIWKGICCLIMKTKEVSMPVKQAIIELKNEKKSIRDIAEKLGVSKSTVWYIVKKQERTGELGNSKRSGRPRKTTELDDKMILQIVQTRPFSTVEQIRNALQDAGVVVSTTTIKRRLHQHHFRWFTKRCKSLDDSTSQTPDQSGMSLLQEQVRREIMQQMKFSPIADYASMDLPSLMGIAQQELALATAISSYVNIPEELVSNLQELISRLGQSMPSAAEAPAAEPQAAEEPAADSVANPPDNVAAPSNDSPSSE